MSKRQPEADPTLHAELRAELDGRRTGVVSAHAGPYTAVVAGLSGKDVIVELGPRVQGVVPRAEFGAAAPALGSQLSVALIGREDGLWIFSLRAARERAALESLAVGARVVAKVVGMNKGGLELKLGGLDAFMPSSQIALAPVADLAAYAGQELAALVIEFSPGARRLVLSRRAVLEAERSEKRSASLSGISPGAILRGKVTRIEAYGAFVEVAPGLEGLLHVSNLSHRRVGHPDELLKIGDEIEVAILEVGEGGKKIALSRRALEADPWEDIAARLAEGRVLTGRVKRIADFGAFVEVEPGIDGLVHVSQLLPERARRVSDALSVGADVLVRVLSVDRAARRIALSRLDERGALLGSEESASGAEVAEHLERPENAPRGTNLGALMRRALGEKP
jgi:small subunit ribosomal protein S1